jgi:hypothetical protein
MKKTGIIALVLLYTLAVVGINLSVHYCGKRVSSVSIGTQSKKCCCGTKKADSCCKTKHIKAKVNDTYTPGVKQTLTPPVGVPVNTDTASSSVIPTSRLYKKQIETSIPPPLGMPLYLRNRSVLI